MFIKALDAVDSGERPVRRQDGLVLELKPTGPISVERSIVVWEDGARRVAVGVSVEWVVSVARDVDAFRGGAGVVVDGFGERPAGGQLWDVAQGAEDPTTGVD